MQKINLKKVIQQYGLDEKEVAKHLFPGNKFPDLALHRIIKGEALLNADQISKLSLMANVSIAELYGLNWKASKKGNVLTLTAGNYKAQLNTGSWVTSIFDNGSLFHESIIHDGSIPLSHYIATLNDIIEQHKGQ